MNEVIKALQLESCRNTYIGDDSNPYMKGISGGEKRRLAIASEILDPSINILMLDEPTSGLDAAAAQNVANLLRTLSNSGMAVLATLHQPRSTIMERFDGLMVLAKGRCIFNGTVKEYTPYLQNELKCTLPEHESPYELLLDALNPVIAQSSNVKIGLLEGKEHEDVGEALADAYDKFSSGKDQVKSDARPTVMEAAPKPIGEVIFNWLYTTWVIFHRTFLIKMRDPICLATQLSSASSWAWSTARSTSTCTTSPRSPTPFWTRRCASSCPPHGCVVALRRYPHLPRRAPHLLERRKADYTSSAFYIARICADVPAHVVSAVVMAIIIWGMAGEDRLGDFMLIMIYGILIGAAVMQMIGAFSRIRGGQHLHDDRPHDVYDAWVGFVRETPRGSSGPETLASWASPLTTISSSRTQLPSMASPLKSSETTASASRTTTSSSQGVTLLYILIIAVCYVSWVSNSSSREDHSAKIWPIRGHT